MVAFGIVERCFSSTIHDPANPMRLLSAIAFLTLFAVTFAAAARAPLPAPHQVDIPLGSGDACTRSFTSPTATARFRP